MTNDPKPLLRTCCAILLLGFAMAGTAQEATTEEAFAEESSTERSAQDAAAALEPAVDVSETPRVAQRTTAPAAQSTSGAIDRLDLGTTSITGNQELPKVLYIVPWKRSDLGNLVGRPVNTLLDEVLAPVDPEVFERHLDYYDTLYGESEQE
jgi:hypothetical protein